MFVLKLVTLYCLYFSVVGRIPDMPVNLTEDTWYEILEGEWMVEFMAPWCPACRSFMETWESFAKWSKDLDVSVGVIDVTENPGLSGRFFVTALPTIYHVKDGVFRQYHGSRKESDLISFIDEKKWGELETVSSWIAPNSIQMATVGLFFKAAMVIRSFYTMMTTEYGIPEWGCYIIFAILTIVTGLILGLLIVCCCDVIFPPKYAGAPIHKTEPDTSEKDKDDESEDIIDDTKENDDAGDSSTTRKRRPQKSE